MAATIDHPTFLQPTEKPLRIWRYIDLPRFVHLLETRRLYFPRLDQLDDPFEGSLSKAEYENWKEIAEKGERDGTIPAEWKGKYMDVLLANARRARRAIYVNCWHANAGESEAMWKLYSRGGPGIAIQSTYDRLVHVLPGAGND